MRWSGCGAAPSASIFRRSLAAAEGAARLVLARAAPGGLAFARSSVDALVSILLAPACAACRETLEEPSAGPVCGRCWHSILPLTPPLCDRCGEPVGAFGRISGVPPLVGGGTAPLLCPRCLRAPPVISLGRSAGAYEGALRHLIHSLKYDSRRRLAKPLAALMRERGREVLDGADVLVPVPLHWRRRLLRGFNQSDDLARHLGLPVCRVLRRRRATRPQFGLRKGGRHSNVRAAFAARRPPPGPVRRLVGDRREALRGACVVLVDDLETTGATLRECAGVLKQLGAREVRTLTAARALTPRR